MKVLCCFFLLVSSQVIGAQEKGPVWISIVRSDSTLVPFTVWNNGVWTTPWPKYFEPKLSEDRNTPITIQYTSLEEIPESWYAPFEEMPIRWYVRTMNGETADIEITKPYPVETWCVALWGLIIGSSRPPEFTHRFVPLVGIALSSDLQPHFIQTVTPDSEDWRRCSPLIEERFKKQENSSNHPLSEKDRSRVGISVKLFRGKAENERDIFYFEATKNYAKPGFLKDNSEYSTSLYSGWIVEKSENKFEFLDEDLSFASYGTMGITITTPLGIVALDGKVFWIVKNRYYEGESYQVIEVTTNGIKPAITLYTGGC